MRICAKLGNSPSAEIWAVSAPLFLLRELRLKNLMASQAMGFDMPFVRFKYLKDQGIVSDRMAVVRFIEREGFPKPLALGANTIAWNLEEVTAWLAGRPRRTPKTGAAKTAPPTLEAV